MNPPRNGRKSVHVLQKRNRGRVGSSRAGRVRRHAIEWNREEEGGGDGTRARTKAYRKNSLLLSHFTRTTSNAFGIAPPPSVPIPRALPSAPPSFRPRLDIVSRRAASSPFAPPISRSLPVSDRVPLFRVLYYFFYQSARFQDALRPAESCAINHEM